MDIILLNNGQQDMYLNLSLYKNGNISLNSLNVFILTLLGCALGSHARLSGIELSVFWPVNIIIAALFYRCRYLNTPWYYFVCYSAMVLQDSIIYGWGSNALTINTANMVFIVVLNKILTWPSFKQHTENDLSSSLFMFAACMIAALACALVGAFAQQASGFSQQLFLQDVLNWFSDQFYTSVLFLPLLLTVRSSFTLRVPPLKWQNAIPIIFLILSLGLGTLIGPIAIVAFPLPALTWCAIVYPLWTMRLITLVTGILELIITAFHVHAIYGHQDAVFMQQITIVRISIAALIFSPLIMAINAKTIRQLNQRLLRQASHDFLTNLLSRYGFTEALIQRGKLTRYRHVPINMMLIDIDHFKKINDSFGHDVGDDVLRQVAMILRKTIQEPGLVSRVGGEEFAVVCFGYSHEAFFTLAETLRASICVSPLMVNQRSIPVAVSIGIAHAPQAGDDLTHTVHHLVSAADKNLYIAKRQGRNQTVQ